MSAASNKPPFYDDYDLKVVDPGWLAERVKPKRHIGLDADLPVTVPIPALAEVQLALEPVGSAEGCLEAILKLTHGRASR